jgi:hypothetical protein
MRPKPRLIVLAALVLGLAAVVIYEWPRAGESPGAPAVRRTGTRANARPGEGAPVTVVPPVRLDALAAARNQPPPGPGGRNLFQFQPKLPPPPPPGAPGAHSAVPVVPAVLPPPPPILVKFIGIVQTPDRKLAVLSDVSTHDVFYGREGDIIDGRYRILRIGVESIEMAYVDGRGRQTIRLTGS